MRSRIPKRRKTAPLLDISMTSMIDTAWTLLIIFMVAAPMIEQGIKVDLPKGTLQEITTEQQKQELTITIEKDGQFYFKNQKIAFTELVANITNLVKEEPKVVKINGDAQASWGPIISLLDKLKQIDGVKHVFFATIQPETAKSV